MIPSPFQFGQFGLSGSAPVAIPAATWNSSDKAAGITLDGTSLIATGGSNTELVRATRALPTGKSYWEVGIAPASSTGTAVVNAAGVVVAAVATSVQMGGPGDNLAIYANTMDVYFNNAVVLNNANVAVNGHTFQFAYDSATRKLWIGRVGTGWFNSGDPAAGTGEAYTLPAGTFYPGCTPNGSGVPARNGTANFGASAFSGSVPSGFTAFNSLA